ncbi:MAG: prohibitin family protein [Chloroflexaceae bacterium]|nr:prohibitin family protein [Chloroflexaceae bacterium]
MNQTSDIRSPALLPKTKTLRGKVAAQVSVLSVVAIIGVFLLALLVASWRTIQPGNVGIVFDKSVHRINETPLEPGWAFVNPFTQNIQEYPVTIQTYSMLYQGVEGDDSIKVQSREGQQVNLDVVIQYRIRRDEVAALYLDWGGAGISVVEDRLVRQYTRSQVPAIAARYNWEEITSGKRDELSEQIWQALTEEFSRRHLELISFGIREVHLPASLQKALNNKIQAQQEAEQQKYQLDQEKVKAEQARVKAEGEANAMRIRAEAEADSNNLLARSLTSDLIRYEQLKRWDGRLPTFFGGGAMPLMPLIDPSGMVGANEPASSTLTATATPTATPTDEDSQQ